MEITDKGKLLKTAGWITVGVGFYLVALGNAYYGGDSSQPRRPDNIIDADFKIIN